MAYFIVLKYLRSLEEFKKNPHVKITPKSPCANPQSLGIFKNQILFGKEFFLTFDPTGPSGPSAQLRPFFPSNWPFPPFPTGPRPLGRPSSPHGPTGHLLPTPASEPVAQEAATGRPHTAPTVDQDTSTGRKKWPHQSPFIPPLIGVIPPLQSLVTDAVNLGPLKLLQHWPLKALGLPRLTSAL
jgi:hypothetical protein